MPETDQTVSLRPSPLPDIGDIIFLVTLQFLVFSVPTFQFGDGSTGWHLFTGDYILTTGKIPHHDIISYTFAGTPWVAYEWLSDVFMAAIVRLAGLNGLNVALAGLIALVQLLLYERCRKNGCHFIAALFLVVAGALASSLHWLARPHVFSFLGVYVFYSALQDFHDGKLSNKRLLLTLALTMLLWVNLHPAFILGFGLVGLYLLCELLQLALSRKGAYGSAALSRSRTLLAAFMLVAVASLVNPCGIGLYRYILHYLNGSQVIANTSEFQSPDFGTNVQPLCLELIFLSVLAGLALRRGKCSLPQFLVVATFGHMALNAVRNIPLFVIVAVPFAAALFADSEIPVEGGAVWWQRLKDKWISAGEGFDKSERRCNMHLLPVAAVTALMVVSLNQVSPGHPQILCSGFDPKHMPTTTLDYIRQHHLEQRRGFNYDNWGGYIRYRLGIPVYIDDRADFYDQRFYLRYGKVSLTQPGWSRILDEERVDWILFPADSRLSSQLMEDKRWKLAASDDAASLFVRAENAQRQPAIVPASSAGQSVTAH